MLVLLLPTFAFALAARDDTGRTVRLEAPARRIVSLSPHVTELLFAAGAGDKVVGVAEHSDWPPAARGRPVVSSAQGIDYEAVLHLKPDLVVAWYSGNPAGQLERLESFGVTLFRSEPRDIDAIADNLLALGRLAGSEGVARAAAARFRERVSALRREYAGRPMVRVFYQIWDRPLMTINGRHLVSQWLALCGAHNIFADMPELAASVDIEAVLAADPDAILSGRHPGRVADWRQAWRRWPMLRAVRNGHLYEVSAERLERQTPRAVEAARELCAVIDEVRGVSE